jgi:hypothetical protein
VHPEAVNVRYGEDEPQAGTWRQRRPARQAAGALCFAKGNLDVKGLRADPNLLGLCGGTLFVRARGSHRRKQSGNEDGKQDSK